MSIPKYLTMVYNDDKGVPRVRLRWVYDEHYQTEGSYAYDTEEETRAAVEEELEALNRGELVALGCIVEQAAQGCVCPECDRWHETDSLWGIVIDGSARALDEFARENGWVGDSLIGVEEFAMWLSERGEVAR